MWPNPWETVDLATFIEQILNGKLHFFVQCQRRIRCLTRLPIRSFIFAYTEMLILCKCFFCLLDFLNYCRYLILVQRLSFKTRLSYKKFWWKLCMVHLKICQNRTFSATTLVKLSTNISIFSVIHDSFASFIARNNNPWKVKDCLLKVLFDLQVHLKQAVEVVPPSKTSTTHHALLTFNSNYVQTPKSGKYLGMILDSKLNFKEQMLQGIDGVNKRI